MASEMDQFYRSTIAIYKSIMEQFNPALENLVYLGNNYLRAFRALSEAAEVYFHAIQKIGEQALQSSTSQILGEILVQMSDTQRHLNSDLEVVPRCGLFQEASPDPQRVQTLLPLDSNSCV